MSKRSKTTFSWAGFEGINSINTLVNSEAPNESLNAMFKASKRFKRFKMSLRADENAFNNNNVINGEEAVNQSLVQSYVGSATTTFFKKLEVYVAYTIRLSNYAANQVENKFTTHILKGKAKLGLSKGLDFETDYSFNAFVNAKSQNTAQFTIWNAYLRYQPKSSPWEFQLAAYNMLNNASVRRDSFNENFISSYV